MTWESQDLETGSLAPDSAMLNGKRSVKKLNDMFPPGIYFDAFLGGTVKFFQKFSLTFLVSLLNRCCKHLPVSSIGQLSAAVLPHVTLP